MARKLRSKWGSRHYLKGLATEEPVNGQMKKALGLCWFLLQGIEKVSGK
jgi:hypothetical protein